MLDLLPVGKANAVTTKTLVEKSGLSAREIQLVIEAARKEGVPVLASDRGYFLAASVEECRSWEASQLRRARSLLRSRAGVRRWRRGVESVAQGTLWR